MAEECLRHLAGERFEACSAGAEATTVWLVPRSIPTTKALMRYGR